MSGTKDAGRTARTETDESREDKGTANHLIDSTLAGAVGGAILGFIEGLADDQQTREQGYHAELDDGRVKVTYVPEVGDERLAMALSVDSANELYKALSDGESEEYHIEPTASGEVLDIYDDGTPIDFPVIEVLADDRESLQHALASVLEDQGAADLLEGVKGVLCEANDFEVLDADRVKVSYKSKAGFGSVELAALRDSEYWISGISPDYIVVEKEGSSDD